MFVAVKFMKSHGDNFSRLAEGSNIMLNTDRILAVRDTTSSGQCALLLIDGTGIVIEGSMADFALNMRKNKDGPWS